MKSTQLMRPIAVTLGEPAGIGPDIVIKLLTSPKPPTVSLSIYGDCEGLFERARQLNVSTEQLTRLPHVRFHSVPCPFPSEPGQLNVKNAASVIESIEGATTACLQKECRALVTGPVHKGILNEANIPFTGHTELLAQLTGVQHTVMLLAAPTLKVALATTHLPLSAVPKAITPSLLTRCIQILYRNLQTLFQIPSPTVLVLGLNPHAGEGGHLGREELDSILPTLETLRRQGMRLVGPVSADTAFTRSSLKDVDVVLAMYHDQGLPVLKSRAFYRAVNITLGLPIVRTSVDHGVALPLAGTGKASESSLRAAIDYADRLSQVPNHSANSRCPHECA